MNNDEMVVKTVWKSAHAVRDWPGMVTIRRFSPFKNEKNEYRKPWSEGRDAFAEHK